MDYLLVGIGGGVGAVARFVVGRKAVDRWGADFPWGTLIVNVTGALIIGFLLGWFLDRSVTHPHLRNLLVAGFLGGYTTFSSYTWEAVALFEDHRWITGLAYLLSSNVTGLLCCALGLYLARTFVV